MIKNIMLILIFMACGNSFAEDACGTLGGSQNFPSYHVRGGVICFVSGDLKGGPDVGGLDQDSILIFYVKNGAPPIKSLGRGLLYDNTPGEIMDVFASRGGVSHRESIFVIHSFDVRYSIAEPNSSGRFYSVTVFFEKNGRLYQDERATDWFGVGYGWLSDGRAMTLRYPYQSRTDVLLALDSPLAELMSSDACIPARVWAKTYLFNEPHIKGKTRKYLIAGDQLTVRYVTAGWCRINFRSNRDPIDMWMRCDALEVGIN